MRYVFIAVSTFYFYAYRFFSVLCYRVVLISKRISFLREISVSLVILPFITAYKSRDYATINGGLPPLALCGRS